MKEYLFMGGSVLLAIVLYLIIFNGWSKKSNLLMRYVYVDKNYEAYRKLSKSLLCRLFLSKKQRYTLDMAVYEGEKNEECLVYTFDKLHRMKLEPQEELNLYINELHYYIRKKDDASIKRIYNEATEKYKDNETAYLRGIVKEIYYIYEVDYKENTLLIDEIKKLYQNIQVEQSKGIFALRLVKLYRCKGDLKSAEDYYNKAVKLMGKEAIKKLSEY